MINDFKIDDDNKGFNYKSNVDLIENLDIVISSVVYPLLEKFKEFTVDLDKNPDKILQKNLEKMIWAHKFIIYDSMFLDDKLNDIEIFDIEKCDKLEKDLSIDPDQNLNDEKYSEMIKKRDNGLRLFAKYYNNLWS